MRLWSLVFASLLTVSGIEISERNDFIRARFRETWSSYVSKAFGADEIDPLTGKAKMDVWGGWGVTLIDSLDTLWILGLKEEFNQAAKKVAKIDFASGALVSSFFEVTIRNLGGLISAYDLSGDEIFLKKAKELGDVLLRDFSSPSGFPYTNFNFKTKKPIPDSDASLANVGSCQLEFTRLSQLTGDPKYANAALKVYDDLDNNKSGPGLYYANVNVNTGNFSSKTLTYGGFGDSFFEYLIKLRIILGPTKGKKYLRMFDESIATMRKRLISNCKDSVCIGRLDEGQYTKETEHLTFFVPGMLLLGDEFLPQSRMGKLGLGLLDTFIALQRSIPTGLLPESARFSNSTPLRIENPHNSLRPELAESLFYAYRFTKDSLYRDRCWDLFVSFDKYSRAKFGYAEYSDVRSTKRGANLEGNMPSYFLAETVKYLYLCQAPESVLPLDKFVLNTEAHPFRIPN